MFHTRRQFVVTVTVTGWNLGAGDVVIEDSAEPPLFPHQQLEESEVALVKDLIGEGQYGYLVSVDDESIVATVDIGAAAHDDAGLRECLRAVGEVTASMPPSSRGCRLPNLGKIWATPNHPNHAQISLEDFVKIHPKSA